jgi:sugar transferase (PEP-CTERM/EpsH1 system associated)
MAGSRPLTVAYFDEPELHHRVRARMTSERFDLALVCSSGMAQYVAPFCNLPKVIQFTDLDSQKWHLYANDSRFPKSLVYRTEADRLLRYERQIARTFDYSMFCSDRELQDFRRLSPETPAGCVRNGVDTHYFRPTAEPKDPAGLVFTGVMNYRPNVDGVVWFCSEVFPRIRERVPEATFTICGAHPSRSVRALARSPGVRVTGPVADVRPYLARATVAVVPVRIARGLQNKLLEAMAMGLPAVTTTAAHGGLDAAAGRELFVADAATDFASTVVRLLRDSRLRDATGHAARRATETRYGWDKSLARLDEIIAAATARRAPQGFAAVVA